MAAVVRDARPPFSWTRDNNLYFLTALNENERYYYSVTRVPVTVGQRERFAYQEDTAIINVGPMRPQVHARADWLYCWPNPTNDESHIRITLSYPAEASIKVFDLAGRKVAELHGSSSTPGPFEVLWDVSDIETGVYVGQVTATGNGTDEQAQVKIAVVR